MTARAMATSGELELVRSLFGELRLRHCPLRPTARQEAFLLLQEKEVFFGGATGGGKSVAMLMAALQYTDVPGYHALLLRPSLSELQLAGGLIELAHTWLTPSKAHWSGDTKTWRFPGRSRTGGGGATLAFGYLADESDLARYAGSSYSYIGFDELTRFDEQHYRRMFRALRQPHAANATAAPDGTTLTQVPVRIRATSNPGGPGHTWVKDRFVDPTTKHPDAVFMRSQLADNPHLDQATYIQTLGELPTAERERLLHGDWEIPDDGELFKRDWFDLIEPHQLPNDGLTAVRYWDLAATEPSPRNRDPDWTVGLLLQLHRKSGTFYIKDIIRERKAPGAIQHLIAATAKRDGRTVRIVLEQEPGAAGVQTADHYKRHILQGYTVRTDRPTGDKTTRAWPAAAAAENGLLKLVRGRHTKAFLDELTSFPHGKHDDCIDALAGAHTQLTNTSHGPGRISIPHRTVNMTPLNRPTPGANHHHPDPIGERLAAALGLPLHPAPPQSSTYARRRR